MVPTPQLLLLSIRLYVSSVKKWIFSPSGLLTKRLCVRVVLRRDDNGEVKGVGEDDSVDA